MRVGIYIHDLAPEAGGQHTYERDIVDAVAARRYATEHDVVTLGYAPNPPDGWDPRSYVSLHQSRTIRTAGKIRRRLASSLGDAGLQLSRGWFDKRFESHGIDVIWCLTAGTPTHSLPYVTTFFDLQHRLQPVFPEVSAYGEWMRRERFLSREIGQAAVVIVGTSRGKAEVERFYGVPPERVRTLPHPTPSFALHEPETDDDDTLSRYGLEPGYVLYPAQFWAHKNHVGLLHAIRLLRDEHAIHMPAVFVGSDKGNETHVRRVAKTLGLSAQVRFLGFVPLSDLVALYRSAFALAYVTFFGPDNLPPLEAFALGCPVVASDVPGADEQLGNAALLVPPTSASGIAEGLATLYRDQSMRQLLIERGRRRARSYTPAHYVEGMFAILDELDPVVRTWR